MLKKILFCSLFLISALFLLHKQVNSNTWLGHQCENITSQRLTELGCLTDCFVYQINNQCGTPSLDPDCNCYICVDGDRETRQGRLLDPPNTHDACVPTDNQWDQCGDASDHQYPYTVFFGLMKFV